MTNWYTLSILSLLFMGVQRFLYKVSAERRCNTAWTTFSFMGTVAVLSSGLFLSSDGKIISLQFLVVIAFVMGWRYAKKKNGIKHQKAMLIATVLVTASGCESLCEYPFEVSWLG